jgi:hypothetical protein
MILEKKPKSELVHALQQEIQNHTKIRLTSSVPLSCIYALCVENDSNPECNSTCLAGWSQGELLPTGH